MTPNKIQSIAHLLSVSMTLAVISGCGGSDSYATTQPAAATGYQSACEKCSSPIATVADKNLFSFQGIRYVVCSKNCAVLLEDDIVHDRLDSHSH